MNDQTTQRRTRRTLIMGVGRRGLAILEALQRRLEERGRSHPRLALLAIVQGDAGEESQRPANGLTVVSIPGDATAETAHRCVYPTLEANPSGLGSATSERFNAMRPEGLTACTPRPWRGQGAALTAALLERLMTISRVTGAAAAWQIPALPAAEIDILVVAELEDGLAGAALVDLVYLARHLIRSRLNAAAQTTGLLLLPDVEGAAEREPDRTDWRAALRQIDQVMAVHDGWVADWAGGVQVEGWGALFDHGCWLLGPLNAHSLALGSPAERNELAAEILLTLATTDAARLCAAPAGAAVWRWGEQAHGYGGVGLAAWVYPAERLIEYASRRMAVELVEAWQTPCSATPTDWDAQAAGFWHSAGAATTALSDQALPSAAFDLTALWRPLDCQVSLRNGRRLRQTLEEQMAERLESLAAQRPALDERAEAVGRSLAERLAAAIDPILDAPAPGRLPEATAWLGAAQRWLQQAQADNEAVGQSAWLTLEAVERELEQTGQRLEARAASSGLPEPTWRSWAGLLLRPGRLWALAQALPELQRLAAGYAALLLRQTAAALDVLRHDLIDAVYEAALAGAARQATRLATLRQATEAAQERLQPLPAAPTGALGFALERSALTPELVDRLYAQARGGLAELLAATARSPARLGGWPGANPDGEDLAGATLDFTRERCAKALGGNTIDDLLLQVLPAPNARLEALHGLVETAVPFLAWDEARLGEAEQGVIYSCALLGLGEGAAARALNGTGEVLFAQTLATGDPQRVTALGAVQGLSLAALGEGFEELSDEPT